MLSGIGPKEHLEQLHIPVIKDLPVGNNLMNHPGVNINFILKDESARKLMNIPGRLDVSQLYQYLTTGAGPLAQHYRSVTYLSSPNNPDKDWPNVNWEVAFYQFPSNLSDFRQFRFGERRHEWAQFLSTYLGRFYIFTHPIVQRVRSRGYVRLASADPHTPPIINPNFLRDPRDYEDLVFIIKYIYRFYELSSMAQHLEPLRPIPGCSFCPKQRYVFECDSYIQCVIEQETYGSYHAVGSNRMGAAERPDTVVDPYLRVKGVDRLRVCDSSIIPLLMNSNTNAASLMIGEKCAQMVKDEQGKTYLG